MKKQSAVEWLKEQIECFGNKHELQMSWATLDELLKQAKEMEKEQTETLYTEEQVIEFTKWLASDWFALWVKDKFLWECDWSENAENQDYKGYYTEKQLLELFKSIKQKPNE
jgi:hypothetical protein